MEDINLQKNVVALQQVKEKKFWSDKLNNTSEGFLADVSIAEHHIENKKEVYFFKLEKQLVDRLVQISKGSDHWLHIIFISNLFSLLYRYTGNRESIICTPVLKQKEDLILNKILPLYFSLDPAKTFKQLLMEVKQVIVEATENQNFPIESLFPAYTKTESGSINTFKVASILENIHSAQYISHLDISILFAFDNNPEGMSGSVTYNPALYNNTTIKNLVKNYLQSLAFSLFNVDKKIIDMDITDAAEKAKIMDFSCGKIKNYPFEKTIIALFEGQVKLTPHKTAVVYNGNSITYKELSHKAAQLASQLLIKGFKAGEAAGLITDRNIDMVVGMLAILKAGGCFLPIDPKYPEDRVNFIIQDSRCSLVLTTKENQGLVTTVPYLLIDSEENYRENGVDLPLLNSSSDLAYIIYTSGTTGVPKGVAVEHRSLVNLCFWHNDFYSVTSEDNATQYAGISFDAAVWEIFPYLLKGSTLHVIKESLKLDLPGLQKYFEENNITISFLPTQFCEQFMKLEHKTLRALLAGGDKLRTFEKRNFLLYNNYGPTENTVVTTSCLIDSNYENIPIGKPVTNNQVYILQKDSNELQPIGVPGELCVSGASLARGYINPLLEEGKFVQNPFVTGKKMYRTGDLAKWLPDGNIEFLGRNDHQVKVRGFRIEIGEIENQILHFAQVKEAVVIAKTNLKNLTSLVAFIVADIPVDTDNIKVYLSAKIPDYMIPAAIVQLDEIPLTPNGKVDKKLLSTLEKEVRKAEYVAPQNDVEKIIADIWKDVLQLDHVGIYDNFFDIGGNSLHIIQVHNLITGTFQKEISVVDLFRFSTVSALSGFISNTENSSEKIIDRSEQIDKGKNRLKNLKQKIKAAEEVG